MKKDIIIGAKGQIGSAIYQCYGNNKDKVLQYDLDSRKDILIANEDNIRCMHICIPCKNKNKFIYTVLEYINQTQSEIVILHSTVPVGTSREIYKQTKNVIVVHSPCCGKHPDLYTSIKVRFTKFFGVLPNSKKAWRRIIEIVKPLFNEIVIFRKPEETELAKILSTTEYAIHIAIATEIKRLCNEYNVNFDNVYNSWRESYNEGYVQCGDDRFTRPILTPCKGKIQGTCIIPNIDLIKKYMKPTWLTDIKPKRLIK